MNEFIFGSLATPEKRADYLSRQNLAVRHQSRLNPPAVRGGKKPLATVSILLPFAIERVVLEIVLPRLQKIELRLVDTGWDLVNWGYQTIWQGEMPAFPDQTLVKYKIFAYPFAGSKPIAADEGETFAYYVGDPAPPDWAKDAIIYQILPDRFNPGEEKRWLPAASVSDIHGGTIQGIIEKLDYIAGMGFNCIWLNPFFPDDTHHGYHATDYFSVNPRLGTMDDINRLIAECHRRGIRLLLDFVANHWGSAHHTFQDARADPDSPYIDWYSWIDYPHDYHTFFGVKALPKLNTDHPGVRDYLFRAADFWLRQVGFDGYRLDYAVGVSLDFWAEFRAVVKAANPQAWIFGEAVEHPDSQRAFAGRLDGCLDFLLLQALRDTIAFGTMDAAEFAHFLARHDAFFPNYFSRPSFLDNHDMNRFLWLVGGDIRKLKCAALIQFTLAGAPIVYYGTEVGLSQLRDVHHPQTGYNILEESRLPMLWEDAQNMELRAYYQWLIQLRRDHRSLRRGEQQIIWAAAAQKLLTYIRSDGLEKLLVAVNLGETPQSAMILGNKIKLNGWEGVVVPLDD